MIFFAAIPLVIWVVLVFARGGFWYHGSDNAFAPVELSAPMPRVAVIIPARNEAEVIGDAVRSLLQQTYSGEFHVFLIDDASTDNTSAVARTAAQEIGDSDRLSILPAGPPPDAWTGKVWAMSQGIQQASAFGADFLLFADADIAHAPDNLAKLVARAESGSFDLVSEMVKLRCESFPERAIVPAFVFFFFMLYPPAWVSRPDRKTAAAAGGCLLARSAAIDRIGGMSAIRNRVIDDCALANAVKRSGGRLWLGQTEKAISLRGYGTWTELSYMISRTAFTQLDHSVWQLLASLAGLAITFLAPPLLLLAGGVSAWMGGAAWALMTLAYVPTVRFYRQSLLWAPLLPLTALFYMAATFRSALEYWSGLGGQWKGRVQDPIQP